MSFSSAYLKGSGWGHRNADMFWFKHRRSDGSDDGSGSGSGDDSDHRWGFGSGGWRDKKHKKDRDDRDGSASGSGKDDGSGSGDKGSGSGDKGSGSGDKGSGSGCDDDDSGCDPDPDDCDVCDPNNVAPVIDEATNPHVDVSLGFDGVAATIAAFDPDSDTLIFTIEGRNAAEFAIDAESGEISTAGPVSLAQANDNNELEITVIVDDGCGGTDSIDLAFMIV